MAYLQVGQVIEHQLYKLIGTNTIDIEIDDLRMGDKSTSRIYFFLVYLRTRINSSLMRQYSSSMTSSMVMKASLSSVGSLRCSRTSSNWSLIF